MALQHLQPTGGMSGNCGPAHSSGAFSALRCSPCITLRDACAAPAIQTGARAFRASVNWSKNCGQCLGDYGNSRRAFIEASTMFPSPAPAGGLAPGLFGARVLSSEVLQLAGIEIRNRPESHSGIDPVQQ